jgi:hypothetical protein
MPLASFHSKILNRCPDGTALMTVLTATASEALAPLVGSFNACRDAFVFCFVLFLLLVVVTPTTGFGVLQRYYIRTTFL